MEFKDVTPQQMNIAAQHALAYIASLGIWSESDDPEAEAALDRAFGEAISDPKTLSIGLTGLVLLMISLREHEGGIPVEQTMSQLGLSFAMVEDQYGS